MALIVNHPLSEDVVWAHSPSVGASAISVHAYVPWRGQVVKVGSVLGAPITVADATVTTYVNGTAMTNGTLTIANSSSASGDLDTASPTAGNNVQEGDVIAFNPSGATGTAVPCTFFAVIRRN